MYSSTSDKLNHRERVASHSTKEHANGRIDLIPLWAREPEEYYNSVRARYDVLHAEFRELQDLLTNAKSRLKLRLPDDQFKRLSDQKTIWSERYQELQHELSEYRVFTRAIASKSWANVFFECARRLLTEQDFEKISAEAGEILRRPEFDDLKKGQSEFSEEERARKNNKNNVKRKLERSRDRGNRNTLVFSDEGGGYIPIRDKRRTLSLTEGVQSQRKE